jgi:hypothetical protein
VPLLLLALAACASAPKPPTEVAGEVVFVRGGVIVEEGVGQPLPDGRVLLPWDWSPGDVVASGSSKGVAPMRAECLPLFHQDLGDVSRLVAMGGVAPDTALAWSPDATRLAVGSHTGDVLVLDGWTGKVLARRHLAETLVKHVAWSSDGRTLYAAEQSPDANVVALDAVTLEPRWTLRLADRVGATAAPDGEDIYGVYQLPGAYGLEVLPAGDLLVVALHSWIDPDAGQQNRSQVLRVTASGEVVAAWPDTPADATLMHPRRDGDRVAVVVDRSATGPAPANLPIGGVQVLSLPDLVPVRAVTTPALEPWFRQASIWDAIDLDRRTGRMLLGFGDGRLRVVEDDGTDALSLTTGAPVMAGDVPIHASIGWGFLHAGERAVFSTSTTNIPWGAASPETRPPSAHPSENTLWVVGMDGEVDWSWSGAQQLQGLTLGPDDRTLVVGAGDRATDTRRDLYGALIFDLGGADRSGEARLQAFCATEGPVFFRQALAPDGRLAVAEHPYADGSGGVAGAYRVTVLR